MKDFFVNLQQVFDRPEQRTIQSLKLLYEDYPGLDEMLKGVMDSHLQDDMITGKRVLVKPNWVLHNRKENDEICMRTHDNFLLAALEVVLKKRPASVTIGDAPVQGCRWNDVVRPPFIEKVNTLIDKYEIPVKIKDFRRVTFDPTSNKLTVERNPITEYVIFDLGKQSYLEPISASGKNKFRVTDYHPDRLSESHKPGMHKYCITRELFENDIVITLPKVKTHQKAGLTNALKILVGINGDKDYLPHHRKGGSDNGGDCYPGDNLFLRFSEQALDEANRRRGKKLYKPLRYLSILLWKLSLPSPQENLAAAWHGNDTTWRMTLDINLIAKYGRIDGKIAEEPQRTLYSLCDGIVGGQGDGPLKADPLPLGFVCFSNISGLTDAAMAILMGFEVKKLPLIVNAVENESSCNGSIFLNGKEIQLNDLKKHAIKTTPPPGWVGYL